MEIISSSQEFTAYNKTITFTHEGKEYEVCLHWDAWDGYALDFIGIDEPEWVDGWEEVNEYSLACTLDDLSDEQEPSA